MKQNGETLKRLKSCEEFGIPSIDCVVYHKGNCVFRYQSGYSDEARKKPVDGTERYNIYSCSKVITCTAVMQLVEKDVIRLDDAVYEYLPEFHDMKKIVDGRLEPVKNTMTVRHLMTMTAGLTYNTLSENLQRGKQETGGRMPTREAMKYLACDPLVFEPGSSWRYSLCHDVLAAIVEVVSGKRFGLYVKENIFDRVGMKHSTFLLPDNELPGITAQYRYDAQSGKYNPCGPQIQTYKLGSEYESGGAGCISTADDYIAFLENLCSGETLLRRDTIARMICPQIGKNAETAYHQTIQPEYSYGLGVRCPKPGSNALDWGWGGAAGAHLAIIPSLEITLFYVMHVLGSPVQERRKKLTEAAILDII